MTNREEYKAEVAARIAKVGEEGIQDLVSSAIGACAQISAARLHRSADMLVDFIVDLTWPLVQKRKKS